MALSKPMYSVNHSAQYQYRPKNRQVWQGYLLSNDERRRIDNLMGRALLDDSFCQELLHNRSTTLLAEFGLSASTQDWLCSIEASSLSELAQAIA